jgi:hypothetical protein
MGLSPFENGLPIKVVGIVIDPTDINDHKEFLEILPEHEESSIIFICVS